MKEDKHKFQKLTPNSNIDLKIYEDAIDFIFDNVDVKNIAISGAYGAGKSSVLESYKKKHNDIRFLNISLAHFSTPEQKEETSTKESALEGKILNQLIHQIQPNKIPQTNFKVKKKVDTKSIVISALLTMLFVISILHITMFDKWVNYVYSLYGTWLITLLLPSTYKKSLMGSGLFCAVIFAVFLYTLVRAQRNKNVFRKISLQGNEIEIFEECEDSYFDKYLNEVVYLFENAEADVIVFEDMDRFNANQIFERLREVNTLVNIQHIKDRKSPLRFFYLLRDDIFESKDRTKFFDYIIPVVPVVDSSNSYDQFISHFEEGRIIDLFDESFLQGLSLYIDDMRILKNIYNEFVIYYNRINTTELDCNKMLAMITYKNLFPRDFSDLQLNQGMVFTIFNKKGELISNEIESLKDQAILKKKEIERAKNEHIISIEELNSVYNDKRARLSNKNYQERQELTKQYDVEYADRNKAIDNVLNGRLPDLEFELSQIEYEIAQTQSKQLREIINRRNIDTIFKITSVNEIGVKSDFNEIKGSDYFDLLKYLIRNGYIDETYADYMTYFYENSLSRIDKTFLRSITDKKAKELTYQLKNPKMVVDRLRPVDFDQEEILNFDLLQYLLQTQSNLQFLNRLLSQLKETKNYKFVGAYFDTKRETPTYIANLNLQWAEIFSCMIEKGALSETQIRIYSIYTLYYSADDSIHAVNIDNCLSDYISKSADYLVIDTPQIDKLIHGFILLGVSFMRIDYDRADIELFKAVYENSLYEMNFDNLSLMLCKVYQIESEADIQHKNYTLVMSHPESPLAQYVNKNIGGYIDIVLLKCDGAINDNEEIAILVLNNPDVSVKQKNTYISSLQTSIISLSDIKDNSLWIPLLDNRLVLYSENNIFVYFGDSKALDTTLVSFINSGETELVFSDKENTFGEEQKKRLFGATIVCNDLSNDKYEAILHSLSFKYYSFDVTGIADEKLKIIIDLKIIKMNLEILQFIRKQYTTQVLYYIKKNLHEYVNEVITTESFDFDEMMEILLWSVDDEIKIHLLKFTDKPLSILNKEYSTAINEHILKNNLNQDDLPNLFASYEKWNHSIQQIINDLAVRQVDRIITEALKLSNKLFRNLLVLDTLNKDKKIELLIFSLPKMDKDSCKEYLNILGLTEYLKVFGRGRPKFEVNAINKRLLIIFQKKNWIDSFHQDEEDTEYYKISRPKSSKGLTTKLL